MKFTPFTLFPAAVIVDLDPIRDQRGFFARSVDAEAFRAHGLPESFVQSASPSASGAGRCAASTSSGRRAARAS